MNKSIVLGLLLVFGLATTGCSTFRKGCCGEKKASCCEKKKSACCEKNGCKDGECKCEKEKNCGDCSGQSAECSMKDEPAKAEAAAPAAEAPKKAKK